MIETLFPKVTGSTILYSCSSIYCLLIPLHLQPDLYAGMRPSTYPDIPPNVGGYPGSANYQGPPNPYMTGGRFPPYQGIAPPPVGMMQQPHAPASPGVTSEGEVSVCVLNDCSVYMHVYVYVCKSVVYVRSQWFTLYDVYKRFTSRYTCNDYSIV